MSIKAGFAETDISPVRFPIKTYLGSVNEIMDPIYAKSAVFDDGRNRIAFLAFDVVIVEWEYVEILREKVFDLTGIPGKNLLVSATHNHACPAVVTRPGHEKEHDYIEFMLDRAVEAVKKAVENLEPVELGVDSTLETRISYNRRFVKRDGTVISQPGKDDLKDILCNEGVIDPEWAVVAVRSLQHGTLVGFLVNFACHACHHMGQVSAGFPGVLSSLIRERYGSECKTLFLNGACGNIIHKDYTWPDRNITMQECGETLFEGVVKLTEDLRFSQDYPLRSEEKTVQLKLRDCRDLEDMINGNKPFVNVFQGLVERGWYDFSLKKLQKLRAETDGLEVIVQVLQIGDIVFAAIPAEYFTEHGLKIKEKSTCRHTFVVTLANGWLGYIPTSRSLQRQGGHESTLAHWSKMAADTGDRLADAAISMIHRDEL